VLPKAPTSSAELRCSHIAVRTPSFRRRLSLSHGTRTRKSKSKHRAARSANFEPEPIADPTRHRNVCDMTARSFLGSIPRLARALPRHWTWTPEPLAEQIASRADACRASPVWKVDAGTDFEERWRLRRWRRIARYCLELTPDNGDAWIVLGHAECRCAYSAPRHQRGFEGAKRAYQVAAKLKRDAKTLVSGQ
jgi:hypothetical protein